MKYLGAVTTLIVLFIFLPFEHKGQSVAKQTVKVKAPFKMPAIVIPDFSKCPRLSIVDYGAVAGDKEKNSLAIAKAIEEANKKGGGIVVIPEGEWLTKAVHLKSNVNLHLEQGAVLLFSEFPDDYLPAVPTTWEGMECYNYSPLIYAFECKNIAITGEGKIKARVDIWKTWYARSPEHMQSLKRLYDLCVQKVPIEERQMVDGKAKFRSHFVQFNRCENVLLEGISIENSPFWVIHPYHSKNVVIRRVSVQARGQNNDGVDPEMTQNLLIEDCTFDQGDDAIAVKSGRDHDAWRLNTPSKNIVIRNCTVKNGHELLAIGSEISGGIENVYMDNCTVVDGAKLNHLLYIKTNERRGAFVKNIYLTNVKSGKIDEGILGIETDVLYQWRNLMPTYERRLTKIKNIYLDNVSSTDALFISRILGEKECPIENVQLNNVTATTVHEQKHIHENVLHFKITD